jgi:hypothetical protein
MASETDTEKNDAPAEADEAKDAASAEEPKAESTAEEPKAEEPKAEEPKAEEPKAEEPKAEEPKAEEPKAEEPKAEEPKAEEPKVSAAKAALAKTKKKREAEAAKTQKRDGDGEEPEKTARDIFVENMPAILIIALLAAAAFVWWSNDERGRKTRSDQAWTDLGTIKVEVKEGDEGFADLAETHKGSTADPYIRIAWASRLYESGEKDKVERARDLLEQVLQENPRIQFLQTLLPAQIKKIDAELADPNVPWVEPSGAPTPEPTTPPADLGAPPAQPVDEHAGHNHGPGEHVEAPADVDEHAGHNHGPGEHVEAPAADAPAADAETPPAEGQPSEPEDGAKAPDAGDGKPVDESKTGE